MTQTFCGQCGAPVQGAFCGTCGAPAPTPAAPTPPPAAPTAPAPPAPPTYIAPPAPPTPAYGAPAGYPAPPTAPPVAPPTTGQAGNPFAGVAVRDVVLDVLALVLLLTSLALPWDLAGSESSATWNDIHDRWWVILSLVIAIFGIGVPYLGATRAVPGLTRQVSLLVKLATVIPAAISIFCVVLFECIHVTHEDKGGIGAGVVVLLVAALLVLVPRTFDDLPGLHGGARAAERALYAVAVAALVITAIVTIVRLFTADSSDFYGDATAWKKALVAVMTVVTIVPLLVPAAASIRGGSVWAPIAAAAVAAYAFLGFFEDSLFGSDGLPAFLSIGGEKLSFPGATTYALGALGLGTIGIGVLFVGGAVALQAGRWHAAQVTQQDRAAWWVRVASMTGLFAAAVGGLVLVNNTLDYAIIKANDGKSHVNGTWIACMVLLAVATVLAGLTGLFAQRFAQQKVLPVAFAGAWFFLGFVLAIVTSTAKNFAVGASMLTPMTFPEVFAVLFAPLLVLGALTVPAAVRRTYGPVVSMAQINAAGH